MRFGYVISDIQRHIGFYIINCWVMSKSTVNEDDVLSITSHFFEPGEDAGTFWCRLCITSGTYKAKAYEATRGRTNLMNHTKTHKNYESEWLAERRFRSIEYVKQNVCLWNKWQSKNNARLVVIKHTKKIFQSTISKVKSQSYK